MAEGLGVAASAIAVVQITGTIVSMTYNYGRDCWDAKDDSKRLLVEARALKNVLEAAEALMKGSLAAERFPVLTMLLTEDPDGLLEVCQDEVASVDKALRKAWNSWCDNHHTVRGMAQLAKWPLKKKRLENALEGIRSLHSAVNHALAVDTGRDVASIHATMGRLEDNMSNLATVVEEIKHMTAATGETAAAVLDSTTRIESIAIDLRQGQADEAARAEKERERQQAAGARQRAQAQHEEILLRLDPGERTRASLQAKQSRLQNERDGATSRWLLDGEPLSTVLQPGGSPRTLWIKGRAGCGKSMLASAVVEHQRKVTALAFFYFDFSNNAESKSETMLRSLAVQLVGECDSPLPAVVTQFAADHLDSEGKVPPIGKIVQLLHDLVRHFARDDIARTVLIVIDALDECADRATLLRHLDHIRGWGLPLSMVLTSHDLPDISERLGAGTDETAASATTIVVAADSKETTSDIDIFVRNQLETDDDFTKWSPESKKKIAAALVGGAGGMFRWVACQLEMLRDCVTEGELDRALASLPRSLSATYTAALQRVKTNRPRVLRLLYWLVVSSRPPTLEEASDFLAVDLTDPTAGPDGSCYFKPSERIARLHDIALFCPTLIRPVQSVFYDVLMLRLAHSTVKDYLERPDDLLAACGPDLTATFSTALSKPPALHPANILGAAHNHVCKTLLGYVGSWRERSRSWQWPSHEFRRDWPLHRVAPEWPVHFHASCAAKSDDADLHNMAFSLFRMPSGKSVDVFANYLTVTHFRHSAFFVPGTRSGGRRCSRRLVQASRYGLEKVIERLLDESASPCRDADSNTACLGDCILAAVQGNHVGALSLLLNSISSLADLGPAGLVLQRAARVARHPDAFRELLNYLSRTGQLSVENLDDALNGNSLQLFPGAFILLVDAGARPNRLVLHQIIEDGNNTLLEHGLPHTEDKELQRALIMLPGRLFDARDYKRDESDALILKLLASRLPGRVFTWAARSEHCRRLAGPSLCPPENAFVAACLRGQVTSALKMIEIGAVDVHAPLWAVAGWGAYPLFVAVFAQQLEIAAACLARYAQVDQRGSTASYYRPLSLAVSAKDARLVRLLAEHGAMLDTVCSEYGTPLQTAAFVGGEEITEFLLTRPGVVVGQTAAPRSPPLAIAHQYAFWTPLRIALAEGHIRVAALLLRRDPEAVWEECPVDVYFGADEVVASSWEVPRPLLVVASTRGDTAVVQVLLDAQARDINGKIKMDDEAAEARGQELAACKLPSTVHRAVLAECLYVAVEHERVEVVQQLLEAGADANARYRSRTPLSLACFAFTKTRRIRPYIEMIRMLMANSADVDDNDDVYDAFSDERWLELHDVDASFVAEALLLLQGLEGNVDLRDTATVVSRIVADRSRCRLVALLLVKFSKLDETTMFVGFDPAMADLPLDQQAIAAAVEGLCHRQLLEALPYFVRFAEEHLFLGYRDGVPQFFEVSRDDDEDAELL